MGRDARRDRAGAATADDAGVLLNVNPERRESGARRAGRPACVRVPG
jgi:hypothetical protein